MTTAECSCGVPGCSELCWPHEWDPIAAGDTCTVTPPPVFVVTVGDDIRYWPPETTPHRVTAPFERWGSGYACAGCIAVHAARLGLNEERP